MKLKCRSFPNESRLNASLTRLDDFSWPTCFLILIVERNHVVIEAALLWIFFAYLAQVMQALTPKYNSDEKVS